MRTPCSSLPKLFGLRRPPRPSPRRRKHRRSLRRVAHERTLERAMPLRGRLGQVAPFSETSFSGDTKRTRAGFPLQTRTGRADDLRFNVAGERADGPRGAENRMLVRMQGRF